MRYEFKREDAYAFANAMGAQYKEYGQELLFRLCPMCGGGDHKDTSTFAINLRTGLCNCLRTSCGYRANFETLLKDFGKTYILGKDYEEYYKP